MSSSSRPVVVTRAEAPDGPLSRELRALGLEVVAWPAVSVGTADAGALAAALSELASYAWIVFASRHAVAAVLDRIPQRPPGLRIAAVGRATALTLRQRGWLADLVPEEASAGALVAAFASEWKGAAAGTRVLYPASSRALPTIAAGLRQLGAVVNQVEAYRTEAGTLDVAQCRALIEGGGLGAVTFASPSAAIARPRLPSAAPRRASSPPAGAVPPSPRPQPLRGSRSLPTVCCKPRAETRA